MGGWLERRSWHGIRRREMRRPTFSDRLVTQPHSRVVVKVMALNYTNLSPSATGLPPTAITCHVLPRTDSFERSFSGCASTPIAVSKSKALVDVLAGTHVRAEDFAGGLQQRTSGTSGK